MRSCPTCGHPDRGDNDFCQACGNYLRWEEPPKASDTAVLEAVTRPPETLERIAAPPPVIAPFDRSQIGRREAGRHDGAVVWLHFPEGEASAAGSVIANVVPGGHVDLVATVRNESEIVDDYDLSVTGIPEGWWTVVPPVVYLVPFGAESGSYEQEVTVRLHPPRVPQAEARLWPIRVVATSRVNGTEAGSDEAGLVIAAYGQFESRVIPERGYGKRSASFALAVRSAGNAPLEVSFHGQDADGDLSFEFHPPAVTVPPGGEATSTVTVSADSTAGGSECEREFTVYAKGGEQVLGGTAVFVQRPSAVTFYRPKRRAWAWITVLAVLAILGVLIMSVVVPEVQNLMQLREDLVRFQKAGQVGPGAFTPPADTRAKSPGGTGGTSPPASGGGGEREPGTFGGTGSNRVCDREKLIKALSADPDKLREWAEVVGVEPTKEAVSSYIRELRPVKLTQDTQVTNHSYAGGGAKPYQAIMQKGTAVLVDKDGKPVTRCRCGNPLAEPVELEEETKCLDCPPNYQPPPRCDYLDYEDDKYKQFDDQDFERQVKPNEYEGKCYKPEPKPPPVEEDGEPLPDEEPTPEECRDDPTTPGCDQVEQQCAEDPTLPQCDDTPTPPEGEEPPPEGEEPPPDGEEPPPEGQEPPPDGGGTAPDGGGTAPEGEGTPP